MPVSRQDSSELRLRRVASRVVGRSYALSKRVAQAKMRSDGDRRIVVLSMGKTGSTAIARATAAATGARVFQVFRLDPSRLSDAEERYRKLSRDARRRGHASSPSPFPGALHLWESDFLLRHPPTEQRPWEVITTVREPIAQAVSAFFHAGRRSGVLCDDSSVEELTRNLIDQRWLRRPTRWFEREWGPALGIDVYEHEFDTRAGYSIIEAPRARVLLLRQESFDVAPTALSEFLSLPRAVPVALRNQASDKEYAAAYRAFLDHAVFPPEIIRSTYSAPYCRHFYTEAERAQLAQRWGAEERRLS